MLVDELPSFLKIVGMALRLDPEIYAVIQVVPGGIWVALAVVLLAGLSESLGQSVVLFLNHVRPSRFGLALLIATLSHIAGYIIWTITIWGAGDLFFGVHAPLVALASAVGLAYAPQLFSFFELTPYLGNAFGVALSLWSMLAVVLAVRIGVGLQTWQAVVLATLGWLFLQALRRTIGRPVLRLQRWLANRAAGVALDVRPADLPRLRRHAVRTWYTQLESWRPRRSRSGRGNEVQPPGEKRHV